MNDLFGHPIPVQSKCTVSQALSALVKSVRMRHPTDAAYWYLHISHCFPEEKFRLHRRMIIMAAEDCIDIGVQRQVHEWFKLALNMKDKEKLDRLAIFAIQRLCATSNWWQSPTGQKYICSWRLANKRIASAEFIKTPSYGLSYTDDIKHFIDSHNQQGVQLTQNALCAHFKLTEFKENRTKYAQLLVDKGIEYKNLKARFNAQVHYSFAKIMGNYDDNWLGHSIYRMMGNELEATEIIQPTDTDNMYQNALKELYSKSRTPPAWTQDGIHCAGKDRRFAGVLSSMVACCNVYNEFGYLSPNIEFKDHHYSSDKLKEYHAL